MVKGFIARLKERARGAEVSQALNPAQQVIKIVHEELVAVLGGEARRLPFAKHPPTVIMLAGLQGSGKTTLAGKLARHLKGLGHQPLLVAADLQRPNAVNQLQVLGKRAGVEVFAPEPGNGAGDPVRVARDSIEHARRQMRDIVIVDTAGRLGIDTEMMQQAAEHPRRGLPGRGPLRHRRDGRSGRGRHRRGVPRRRRHHRRGAVQAGR